MKKLLQTKAIIENVEGKLMAVASEEIPDRDGDIISIDGWELKNFKKNPVMLFLHNLTDRALPIGKAEGIGIKEINGKRKLVFSPVFEEITELGRTVSEFFKQGFMKAFSVGFLPLEAEKISAPDEWPPRFKFNHQELLEISAVPVPALPTATILDQSKSLGLNMAVVNSLVKDMEGVKITEKDGEGEDEQKEEKPADQSDEGEGQPKPTDGEKPDGGEPSTGNVDGATPDGSEDDNGDKAQETPELKAEELANVVKVQGENLKKLESMLKHLIGEVQANRRETKKTVTSLVLQEALGKFAEILPKAIEIANQKKKILEDGGGKT